YIGFVLGNLGCAMANSFELLLISRIVAGAFGGILGAVIFAIVGDVIPAERRGVATGKVMSAFAISSVLGIPFGLELALYKGWNFPFWVLSIVSALILILSFITIPSVTVHFMNADKKMSTWELMKDIPKNKNQLYSILCVGLLMLSGFVFIPFIAPYLVRNNGYAPSNLKWIYFFGGIASFFTSFFIGKLIDRYGATKVFKVTMLCSIFPMLILTNLPACATYMTLIVTTLFFIGNSSRISPAVTQLNNHVEPMYRGNFLSINSYVQSLFTGMAVIIGGVVIREDAQTHEIEHFNVAGLIAVFFCVLVYLIARNIGREFKSDHGRTS
ncbi:MAG TPA: MFS transporter, partial [Cytophagales bacterium]|nr:MFS transporter [Cytophagales bacterium]